MLSSSLFTIDELDVSMLPSNLYKQLLDLKTHVKLDFKNMHPENVTEGMPCIINTNDDIFKVMRKQKRYGKESVDGALRRLYIVPVKGGTYERLHGRVPKDSPRYSALIMADGKFDAESSRLKRMFNLIVSFALFQDDLRGFYFDQRLHGYFQKLANDFSRSAFGTFYLTQKTHVDDLVKEVEKAMVEENVDDTDYLVKVATCAGQFQ